MSSVVLSEGSIIVNFVLLPPTSDAEPSNQEVLDRLRALLQNGTIIFKPLTVVPGWLKTWIGKFVVLQLPTAAVLSFRPKMENI